MTTAVIVILALMVAIQSLIIHRKNKKIDALEYSAEFNLKALQTNKRMWAEMSPIDLMHRAYSKLRNDEQELYVIRTCRSYAASILRIK